MLLPMLACACTAFLGTATAVTYGELKVTLSNKEPRLSTTGTPINAHDGPVVGPVNGTYFLYGEWYGDGNFVVANNPDMPKLAVYTSRNLSSGSWEFRGLLHNNTNPTWAASPHWPWAPAGAWYSPSAVFSEARQKFIMYWSASQTKCCTAQWGVAQSDDGVHFELMSMTETASLNSSLDGSSLFIDDDGVGYVAYDAMGAPGMHDHVVAIDRLSPDLLSSSGERVALLPDYFVEGTMLFKRKGRYYIIYGSCCCACRQGSGAVVLSAPKITGPWVRQSRDVNCKADVPVCAGMPSEQGEKVRPTGHLTISAQGIAISTLRGADGENIYLWNGMRWLSGPHNPPNCTTLCQAATGVCAQSPQYRAGADFDYWIPLEFDADGNVMQFKDFVDDFQLSLAMDEGPEFQLSLATAEGPEGPEVPHGQ